MSNLIQNSNWQLVSPEGGPLHFSGTGPLTYDNFCLDGNRTCSVTMMNGAASDKYDNPINVRGRCAIAFGYILRAIEADSIMLCANFSNENNDFIESKRNPIENRVSHDFKYQVARFSVPAGADTVHLSLLFEGRIIACTFCAPYAEYS